MSEIEEATAPAAWAVQESAKTRGGRPTRSAAAARDERVLEIATQMFMEQGFDATSMDRLAEAAAVGKATLYARYADKNALFAAVLRRRIMQVFLPLEAEFGKKLDGANLETSLQVIARRFLDKSIAPESIALSRILSAQALRFPDIAQLAIQEGRGRQIRLVEGVLRHFANDMNFSIEDLSLAAELFLSIVLGNVTRYALLGSLPPREALITRGDAAVKLFVRGLTADTARHS
jgi:TetR/AcrR family transcriptional regulator, mexJK operon transcriptional repressor